MHARDATGARATQHNTTRARSETQCKGATLSHRHRSPTRCPTSPPSAHSLHRTLTVRQQSSSSHTRLEAQLTRMPLSILRPTHCGEVGWKSDKVMWVKGCGRSVPVPSLSSPLLSQSRAVVVPRGSQPCSVTSDTTSGVDGWAAATERSPALHSAKRSASAH